MKSTNYCLRVLEQCTEVPKQLEWSSSGRLKKCITGSLKCDSSDVYLSKFNSWYHWCKCMWLIHVTGWQDTYIFSDWQIRELRGCNVIGWRGGGGWEAGMRWHRARQSNQWDSDMWACFTCTHVNENAAKKNKKSNSDFIFEGTTRFWFRFSDFLKLTGG